jgi:hypothetical protein
MVSARKGLPSTVLALATSCLGGGDAWGLDKQAPARRGGGGESTRGFGLAGEVFLGHRGP